MKIAVISFTSGGYALSLKLRGEVKEFQWKIFSKCAGNRKNIENGDVFVEIPLQEWAGQQFEMHRAILFIGATGIAVRAIAPFVENKLTDVPVLVMDEKGSYVIPLLSGHLGGANEIAGKIAEGIKAEPVITTATDRNDKLAVDVFAKENEMTIKNKEAIALVSARVLENKPVRISIPGEYLPDVYIAKPEETKENQHTVDTEVFWDAPEDHKRATLVLEPKEYVLGIGCKKGKTLDEISSVVRKVLDAGGIPMEQVGRMASIDIKSEEEGLQDFSETYRIPFWTYDANVLKEIPGEFSTSAFVKDTVGVDCVCERAAIAACEGTGKLVIRKQARDGVTVAVAKRKWSIHLDEE